MHTCQGVPFPKMGGGGRVGGVWLEIEGDTLSTMRKVRSKNAPKKKPTIQGNFFWYVLWYVDTKMRPKGAWMLNYWRKR